MPGLASWPAFCHRSGSCSVEEMVSIRRPKDVKDVAALPIPIPSCSSSCEAARENRISRRPTRLGEVRPIQLGSISFPLSRHHPLAILFKQSATRSGLPQVDIPSNITHGLLQQRASTLRRRRPLCPFPTSTILRLAILFGTRIRSVRCLGRHGRRGVGEYEYAGEDDDE